MESFLVFRSLELKLYCGGPYWDWTETSEELLDPVYNTVDCDPGQRNRAISSASEYCADKTIFIGELAFGRQV